MTPEERTLNQPPARVGFPHTSANCSFWLTDLLASRSLSILCLGLLVLFSFLPFDRIPVRFCVFHLLSGIDCPGCGMTRALSAMCQGDLAISFSYHPFALFVLIFLLLQSSMLLVPDGIKESMLRKVEENRFRVSGVIWTIVILFFLFGAVRASLQGMSGFPGFIPFRP